MKKSFGSFQKLRILELEESLRSRKGHYFEFAVSLHKACEIRGYEFRCAVHRDADESVSDILKGVPLFNCSRLDKPSRRSWSIFRRFRLIAHNLMVFFKMRNYLKENERFDILLFPTVSHYHLFAIWVLQRLHPDLARRVVLFFVQQPSRWPDDLPEPVPDKIFPLLRLQLRLFSSLVRDGRTVIATETKYACREYRSLTGYDVKLWPHPVELNVAQPIQHCVNQNHIVFGSFGFARHEKGSDILVEVLAMCLADPGFGSCRFVIQWGDDFELDGETRVAIPQWIRNHAQVEVIDEPLTGQEYEARLGSVSAVILPYRRSSYYGRLSRVSIEAACCGIPMIVAPETDLVDVMRDWGAGLVTASNSAASFVDAMRAFMAECSNHWQIAGERAPHARQHFSGTHFISTMIQAFDPAKTSS